MNILTAIHRLAETGAGRVKTLQGEDGERRLRVGDYRVRFTEESAEEQSAGNEENKDNEGTLRIHTVRHRREAYR